MLPFILRFASPIPASKPETLRYDTTRQLTQTLKDGEWMDRLSAPGQAGENTRFTRVRTETTDDE